MGWSFGWTPFRLVARVFRVVSEGDPCGFRGAFKFTIGGEVNLAKDRARWQVNSSRIRVEEFYHKAAIFHPGNAVGYCNLGNIAIKWLSHDRIGDGHLLVWIDVEGALCVDFALGGYDRILSKGEVRAAYCK